MWWIAWPALDNFIMSCSNLFNIDTPKKFFWLCKMQKRMKFCITYNASSWFSILYFLLWIKQSLNIHTILLTSCILLTFIFPSQSISIDLYFLFKLLILIRIPSTLCLSCTFWIMFFLRNLHSIFLQHNLMNLVMLDWE